MKNNKKRIKHFLSLTLLCNHKFIIRKINFQIQIAKLILKITKYSTTIHKINKKSKFLFIFL